MTTATKTTIELYYASTLHETMPFDNVPGDGIEYIDDFDSIEDAARWADVNGTARTRLRSVVSTWGRSV